MDKQPTTKELSRRLDRRAKLIYAQIQKLYKVVNRSVNPFLAENKLERNSLCQCGSGKKWKKCCLAKHEERTKDLEQLVKNYKQLCIQIRKLNRSKIK